MKKIMIALLVLMTGFAVSAQETAVYKGDSYKTNSVPEPILIKFLAVHTDPVFATWETSDAWWHASYKDEETSITHVYYSRQPYYLVPVPGRDVDYKVILPVINTDVPAHVRIAAINIYGGKLYSITKLKLEGSEDTYQVGLIENGNFRSVLMNPNLTASAGKMPE
jgi:hypothetical protein